MVENFVDKKKVNLSTFSDSNNQRLDANFFEAILIWIDEDKNLDHQNKLEECIPLSVCSLRNECNVKWREKKGSKVLSKD